MIRAIIFKIVIILLNIFCNDHNSIKLKRQDGSNDMTVVEMHLHHAYVIWQKCFDLVTALERLSYSIEYQPFKTTNRALFFVQFTFQNKTVSVQQISLKYLKTK